jgi:deoxycytidine triphosphate deaminase
MYLTDRELKSRLDQLDFCTDNAKFPFLPDEQIQPCSIDVRLSNIFWKPQKNITIDLRKSKLMEMSPRRYWERIVLSQGESITIKPGQLLLGRIYEKLTVPHDCAVKVSGRSSFARMGLQINCTGDFANPGYRGHFPLQLVNMGPHSIKIVPYISICQIHLVRLSEIPERFYGDRSLQSKYLDDDGGPSYWWRDKSINRLQKALGEVDLSLAIQNEILEMIGPQEPEIIERFEKYINTLHVIDIENSQLILASFAGTEGKQHFRDNLKKTLLIGIFPLLLSISLGSLLQLPITIGHYIFWGLTAISIPISLIGFRYRLGKYLDETELQKCKVKEKVEC